MYCFPCKRMAFSCSFTEGNLLSVWPKRAGHWRKALIFPSKTRAVPVALPSSWVSCSLNMGKNRWCSLFLYHFSSASAHFSKKKLQSISAKRQHDEKQLGIFTCAAHTEDPRSKEYPCLLPPVLLSICSCLFLQLHAVLLISSRDDTGKRRWKRACGSSKLGHTTVVGKDVGWGNKERRAMQIMLFLRWGCAVPQKPSAGSTVSPTDQEPDAIPAADTSGLLQNSKPSSCWASTQPWGVSTAPTELWSFTCCWHPNAVLREDELMPGITKILLSLWAQIPVFGLIDPALRAESPFGVLWGLPSQSYPRSP